MSHEAAAGMDHRDKPLSAITSKWTSEEERTREALEVAPRQKRVLWFATRAEAADPDELYRLFLFAGDDKLMQRMIAARWAERDPGHMFETMSARYRAGESYDYSTMKALMDSWAKSDPAALVAALDDDFAYPGIDGTRMTASDIIMRQHPEIGLSVLEKWGIRHFIPRMDKVTEWAKTNPRAAAEMVSGIDADYAGWEAMKAVARAWAEVDVEAAMEFAAGLRGKKRSEFLTNAMQVWAAADFDAALAYAESQDDTGLRGLMASGLLAEWGKRDPAAAIAWADENLLSRRRTDALANLVSSLAQSDVTAAAEVVANMDGGGRHAAARELLQVWIRESDGDRQGEVIDWLGSLDDHAFAARTLESNEWLFTFQDTHAMVPVVEGEHTHLASDRVIRMAAEAQVRSSPRAALEWADGLPEDRSARAGLAVVREWVQLQPDAASAWALAQPAGERRNEAVNALARSYARRPLTGLSDWLGVLPTDDRARAVSILEHTPGSDEKKAEIAGILAGLD